MWRWQKGHWGKRYQNQNLSLIRVSVFTTFGESLLQHPFHQQPPPLSAFHRKGAWYGWNPSSSSNFSIRVVRAYPLLKIRQTVPCRAIRGICISVNSTLPPSYFNQWWRRRVQALHGHAGGHGVGGLGVFNKLNKSKVKYIIVYVIIVHDRVENSRAE